VTLWVSAILISYNCSTVRALRTVECKKLFYDVELSLSLLLQLNILQVLFHHVLCVGNYVLVSKSYVAGERVRCTYEIQYTSELAECMQEYMTGKL